MAGVGRMAPCRDDGLADLVGAAGGVASAVVQARALYVCVGSIFRVMGCWRDPVGGGNAQQNERLGDGVWQDTIIHAIASLQSDATFLA